jgi:hypothetical protein
VDCEIGWSRIPENSDFGSGFFRFAGHSDLEGVENRRTPILICRKCLVQRGRVAEKSAHAPLFDDSVQ